MSIYDDFREDENATVIITNGITWTEVPGGNPVQTEVIVFNNPGIFYELSASEAFKRQQIQKISTHGLILDPVLVTTKIDEKMKCFVTTSDTESEEYRIVTAKNPLNKDEVVILDLIRVE